MVNQTASVSILIIEDVAEMRALLEQIVLGIEGVLLSGVVQNGLEARWVMHRRRPDLVFLDEILPGESSFDLLRDFSQLGIPVALMSGMENPNNNLPLGAVAKLKKPSWNRFHEVQSLWKEFILGGFWRESAKA